MPDQSSYTRGKALSFSLINYCSIASNALSRQISIYSSASSTPHSSLLSPASSTTMLSIPLSYLDTTSTTIPSMSINHLLNNTTPPKKISSISTSSTIYSHSLTHSPTH